MNTLRREPATQTGPVLAIGVDGCPTGWFFVELQPSGITRSGVVRTLQELVCDAREPARLYVDMPIGLPEGPGGRECDHLARRELGPRGSSVFPAPARAVLDAVEYESAKQQSLRTTGRSLSKQAWAIVPKCREVDRLLRDDAKARRIVREVHPDLCFWALAGGRPMQYGKKHELGVQERIDVLRQMHLSAAGEAAAMLERRPAKCRAGRRRGRDGRRGDGGSRRRRNPDPAAPSTEGCMRSPDGNGLRPLRFRHPLAPSRGGSAAEAHSRQTPAETCGARLMDREILVSLDLHGAVAFVRRLDGDLHAPSEKTA